jgi:DNA-directed RNA polymerase subunit RPC12/RpoP
MAERVSRERVLRERGYLYFLGEDGYLWRTPTRVNVNGTKSRVGSERIIREEGYVYFLDKEGFVSRAMLQAGASGAAPSAAASLPIEQVCAKCGYRFRSSHPASFCPRCGGNVLGMRTDSVTISNRPESRTRRPPADSPANLTRPTAVQGSDGSRTGSWEYLIALVVFIVIVLFAYTFGILFISQGSMWGYLMLITAVFGVIGAIYFAIKTASTLYEELKVSFAEAKEAWRGEEKTSRPPP